MKNTKFIQTLTGLILAACTGSSLDLQADEAPQFEVTVLIESDPAKRAYALALNNKSEALGYWMTDAARGGGLLIYPNGTIVNLTGLVESCGGFNAGFHSFGVTNLNDKTQIIGACNKTAMVYTLAEGPVLLTEHASEAFAINDAGQVVGMSDVAGLYKQHAVFFPGNGTMIDLGAFSNMSFSRAIDINDRYGIDGLGQVVGYGSLTRESFNTWGFLYENGVMSNLSQVVCIDQSSIPKKINNKGEIVGYCYNETQDSGFIYESSIGTYTIFPGYIMVSINDAGWVISNTSTNTYETEGGYLIIDGVIYNLLDLISPTLGVTAVRAIDINDRGQILAWTNLGYVLLSPIHDR